MSSQITPRVLLMKQIELQLGSQMVDVELDVEHFNLAITIGIQKLRQQSDGANLESHRNTFTVKVKCTPF